MADKQTDFLLPSEFLPDGDILMDPYSFEDSVTRTLPRRNLIFPSEFFHDPFFSTVDALENESYEEELFAALATRLNQTTIEETNKAVHIPHPLKNGWVLSRSPQSTLAPAGGWTGRSTGSSNGSPNGPSQVSSPTTPSLRAENDAWDLIYRDAVQFDRLKLNAGEGSLSKNCSLLDLPPPISPAHLVRNGISGVHITPYHQVRRLQMLPHEAWGQKENDGFLGGRQLSQKRGASVGFRSVENCRYPPPLHSLPPQQQNMYGGAGTRAVFSGGSDVGGARSVAMKRECAGTGVFIPRRYDSNYAKNSPDPRKTIAKVSNGVNKRLEAAYNGVSQPQMHPSGSSYGAITDYDMLIARRNAAMISQRMRSLSPEVSISPELRLPPEWTY